MIQYILYDTRNVSGTTKSFAEKLGNALNIPVYSVIEMPVVQGKYIICTYTDGLGEVPTTTETFLGNETNQKNIIGVVGNGSSNFKTMGLFAKVGEIISERFNVELLKKLDMGGTMSDVLTVAKRLNYKYKMNIQFNPNDFVTQSTYKEGKFSFKSRIN